MIVYTSKEKNNKEIHFAKIKVDESLKALKTQATLPSMHHGDYFMETKTLPGSAYAKIKGISTYDPDIKYTFSDEESYAYRKFYLPTNASSYVTNKYVLRRTSISKLFIYGEAFDENINLGQNPIFNFADLYRQEKETLEKIKEVLQYEDPDVTKMILRCEHQHFAQFYYDIFPYLSFQNIASFNIEETQKLHDETTTLGIRTDAFDEILNVVPVAETNSEILSLARTRRK